MKIYIPKTKNLLVLYFLIIIVLPFTILFTLFYKNMYGYLENQTLKSHSEIVNQANLSLQNQLTQIYNCINKIARSNELEEILKTDKLSSTGSDLYNTYKDLDRIFYSSLVDSSYYYGLVIQSNNNQFYFNSNRNFILNNPHKDNWEKSTAKLKGGINWISDYITPENEKLLIFSKQILDSSTRTSLGYIYLAFRESIISTNLTNYFQDNYSSYVLTSSNHCLFSSGIPYTDLPQTSFPITSSSDSISFIYNSLEYIGIFSKLNDYNVRLLTLYPSKIYTANMIHVTQLFTTILVIILVCFFIFSLFLYKWFIQPLSSLCALFNNTTTESSSFISAKLNTYEFKSIGNGIISLMKTNTTEKQQIIKLSKDNDKFLLDKIQAQMNPHFLYNTLTSIKYLSLQGRNQEVATLTTSLVKLLRSSINRDGDFITVSEELQNLKYYINIQSIFYNKIQFTFETLDLLDDYLIPNFILQPLIENSIFHGIEPSDPNSKIIIRNKLIDNRLLIEIEDNGKGFDIHYLNHLNNAFSNNTSTPFSNMGLTHIDTKIKLLCGMNYGLTIYNTSCNKTVVQISLPLKISCKVPSYDQNTTS